MFVFNLICGCCSYSYVSDLVWVGYGWRVGCGVEFTLYAGIPIRL